MVHLIQLYFDIAGVKSSFSFLSATGKLVKMSTTLCCCMRLKTFGVFTGGLGVILNLPMIGVLALVILDYIGTELSCKNYTYMNYK